MTDDASVFDGYKRYRRDEATGEIVGDPFPDAAQWHAEVAATGAQMWVPRWDRSAETAAKVRWHAEHGGRVVYYGSARRRGPKRA